MPTNISWTDRTWNPVTGCTPVSPACDHCYAARMANRLRGRFGYPQDDPFAVTLHQDRLDEPLKLRKPQRIFVCSMGDLFHSRVPWRFIDLVFDAMVHSPQHTFQLLTKRPGRMAEWARALSSLNIEWPSNVWAGVTVEQEWDGNRHLIKRLDVLARLPRKVKKFVSLEPLLGPVDLRPWLLHKEQCCAAHGRVGSGSLITRPQLDWVIVGGESGPRARPMHPDWVRSVRDQCQEAGVPFHEAPRDLG